MLQPAQHLPSPCRIPTQGSLAFPSQHNGGHNFVHYADETLMGGLIVPQTCYVAPKPYIQLDDIRFRVGETLGIKLVDALNPGFTGLDNADFVPSMSEYARKLTLRIKVRCTSLRRSRLTVHISCSGLGTRLGAMSFTS